MGYFLMLTDFYIKYIHVTGKVWCDISFLLFPFKYSFDDVVGSQVNDYEECFTSNNSRSN